MFSKAYVSFVVAPFVNMVSEECWRLQNVVVVYLHSSIEWAGARY